MGRHKIFLKSRKWYLRIFYKLVDLSVVNAWFLYKRAYQEKGANTVLKQADFRSEIAETLTKIGTAVPCKRRRSRSMEEIASKRKRGPTQHVPPKEIRTDQIGHWPLFENGKMRCKYTLCKELNMSTNSEVHETDITWKSEIDIVKDLAILNDFGDPGDTEPYKVLYSIGRGTKIKDSRKSQKNFVDLRTGEDVIDVEDVEVETYGTVKKGQGRGRLLGNSSNTKFQLQEQLRLARPLGSGDGAIESYCRRNRSCGNSTSTSDSDPESQNGRIAFKSSSSSSDSRERRSRILGTRNSMLQSNALISNLLYKYEGDCDGELTTKMQNLGCTEGDNCSKDNTEDNSSSCNVACAANDEHNVRKHKKPEAAYGKLMSNISKTHGNENYEFSQNCTTSTETNSHRELLTSKMPNELCFLNSDSDFPPLNSHRKKTF